MTYDILISGVRPLLPVPERAGFRSRGYDRFRQFPKVLVSAGTGVVPSASIRRCRFQLPQRPLPPVSEDAGFSCHSDPFRRCPKTLVSMAADPRAAAGIEIDAVVGLDIHRRGPKPLPCLSPNARTGVCTFGSERGYVSFDNIHPGMDDSIESDAETPFPQTSPEGLVRYHCNRRQCVRGRSVFSPALPRGEGPPPTAPRSRRWALRDGPNRRPRALARLGDPKASRTRPHRPKRLRRRSSSPRVEGRPVVRYVPQANAS
jgi:hypothetical protein